MTDADRDRWWILIHKFALAQLDFPHGIGVRNTLRLVNKRIGKADLYEVPPPVLEDIVDDCRKKFINMRKKSTYHEKTHLGTRYRRTKT